MVQVDRGIDRFLLLSVGRGASFIRSYLPVIDECPEVGGCILEDDLVQVEFNAVADDLEVAVLARQQECQPVLRRKVVHVGGD